MSQGSWQRSRCPWAAGKSSRGLLPAPPLPSWSLWAQPRAHSPCHSPAPPQTPGSASGTHLWLRCALPVCSPLENANWHAAVVLSGTFLIGFRICCCFLALRLLDFPLPLIFFFHSVWLLLSVQAALWKIEEIKGLFLEAAKGIQPKANAITSGC